MAGALIKLSKLIASGTTGPTMMDSPCMSLSLRRLSGLTPKRATTKIGVVIRSFDTPLLEKSFFGLPPNTGKIGLPDSRVLYTVLRSPHIDKKSREQFEMRIKKRYLVIEAERHELQKKFFWLKRQRIFGAQYEIKFSCNTRLDKGKLQQLLSGSSSSLEDSLSNIWGISRPMFEKAIKVIMLAQEEAKLLGNSSVGTEQILLGLIGEGSGIAAKALGISLEDARVEVEKIIGRGSGIVDAEISFTPRAKRLLELSLEESRQLGHDYIGAEHLLLGLLCGEGEAARVLENLGADPVEIHKQVISMMRETAETTVSADDKREE